MYYNKPKAIAAMISAWVLFIAGAVLLIAAKIKCAEYDKTEAVVVLVDKSGKKDRVTYSYKADSETVEGTMEMPFWTSKHEGDHVTVRYDPNDPAKLENTSENNLLLVVTLAFGVSAVCSTIAMIRRQRTEDEV